MKAFRRELEARRNDPAGRRWVFVPYDQLNDGVGPLAREDPKELGIVLVENRWTARRSLWSALPIPWRHELE